MIAIAPATSPEAPALLHQWLARHGQTPGPSGTGAWHGAFSMERASATDATLFDGWIDNIESLREELGAPGASSAAVYELAWRWWGDGAEDRIVGCYAAISCLADGGLRLARSPLNAPPLSFARHGDGWIAASLPSAFAALGVALELDWDAVADLLAMDMGDAPPAAQYLGLGRVPLGSVVTLAPEGAPAVNRWYAARPPAPAGSPSDAEALGRVERLLAEATRAALAHSARPAIALSGGLDSPTVAAELLTQMPAESRLHGICFAPLDTGASDAMPGAIGDEWGAVRAFAAMHPRLAAHRTDAAHGGHDHRFREIAALAGRFNPALSHFGAHHGVWQTARDLGCDWLFGAEFGNQTFSADGRWAYAEDFARLRWGRMLRNLRGRPGDARPLWRKVLALAVHPHLPRPWRRRIAALVRPSRADALAWNSVLSPWAIGAYRKRASARGSAPAWEGFAVARDRRDAARRDLLEQEHEHAEITLALELRYGVRYRDVTAYRPLVEYCMALPTAMFVRDGQHRYLARQLARGRMPEAQRLEQGYGRHGSDWHRRMQARLPELAATIDAIEGHPRLAAMLDTVKMRRMLAAFPAADSPDEFDNLPYTQGFARAFLAAQYVGLAEGRNDL